MRAVQPNRNKGPEEWDSYNYQVDMDERIKLGMLCRQKNIKSEKEKGAEREQSNQIQGMVISNQCTV